MSPPGSPRRGFYRRLVVLWAAVTLAGAAFMLYDRAGRTPAQTLGGDFTLSAPDGRPWSLASARGRVVLLEFGYTHCPDVCPVNLAQMAEVLRALGPAAERVQALFVSVDPRRDTPEVMGRYTGYFSARILGLTGTLEALADLARRYGAYFAYDGDTASDSYYVQHSSSLYLIDPEGELAEVVPARLLGASEIAAKVRDLLP